MKDVYEVPAHEYGFAGFMNKVAGNPDKDGNITSGAFAGMSGNIAGGLGALGSAIGGMAGSAIAGGRESTAGNIIGGLGDIASAIPGPWGAVAGAGLKVIGGLTNAAFGVKLNQENINAVNNNIASLNNFQSNASSFDDLAQNINSQPTAMRFDQNFIGKNGWFNKGATKKFNQLQAQQDIAQQFVNNSLDNNMNNLVSTQNQNLLANYAAKGGPLETQGSDWATGLNYIGAGGSHEQNPNGGVQQGIAPDGLPNLVEEGEVIWNGDYVFSKRLKVPKAVRNKYKLRGTKPLSFADAALEFNKEMDERPNDPISKRGRDGMLAKLADAQEEKRAKIQAKEQAQQAAMVDMMGMPQDQMAMQEPMVPEEQPVDEMSQGMPMVEGYAAKGGPIGHRYDDGSWKLTQPYLDWLNTLDANEYNALVGSVYDPKKNPKRYAKYTGKNGRQKFFDQANYKSIGDVHRAISAAYVKANPTQYQPINSGPFNFSTASQIDLYGDSNPYGWIDTNPEIITIPSVASARSKAQQRWENYAGKGTPTGVNLATYRPPLATTPIVESRDTNGDSIVTNVTPYGVTKSGVKSNDGDVNVLNSNYPWQGYLRYAPAIGSALGVFSDLMGWTNKPDYSAANAIAEASRNVRDVSFRPIGDYAQYRPVDTRFALNTLNSAAGANRRGILNTSAGNRGTAMAGILASDNNYMNNIGNTLFSAENANYDRYMKALAHNTDVNKFNSEGFLKASMANQGAGEVRARYAALAADARQKALQYASAARSANLTNLFDNLGNIGIDALNRADARWLAQYWPGSRVPSYDAACGGRINKRRRRRII